MSRYRVPAEHQRFMAALCAQWLLWIGEYFQGLKVREEGCPPEGAALVARVEEGIHELSTLTFPYRAGYDKATCYIAEKFRTRMKRAVARINKELVKRNCTQTVAALEFGDLFLQDVLTLCGEYQASRWRQLHKDVKLLCDEYILPSIPGAEELAWAEYIDFFNRNLRRRCAI